MAKQNRIDSLQMEIFAQIDATNKILTQLQDEHLEAYISPLLPEDTPIIEYNDYLLPASIPMPLEQIPLPPTNGRTKREDLPALSYVSNPIILMEESTSNKQVQPPVIEISDNEEDPIFSHKTLTPPSSSPFPLLVPTQNPQSDEELLTNMIGFMYTMQSHAMSTTLLPILEELPTYQQAQQQTVPILTQPQ